MNHLFMPRTCFASFSSGLAMCSLENLCTYLLLKPNQYFKATFKLAKKNIKWRHVSNGNALHRKSQELMWCARQDNNLQIIYRTGKMSVSTAEVCIVPGVRIWKSSSPPLGRYYTDQVDRTQNLSAVTITGCLLRTVLITQAQPKQCQNNPSFCFIWYFNAKQVSPTSIQKLYFPDLWQRNFLVVWFYLYLFWNLSKATASRYYLVSFIFTGTL